MTIHKVFEAESEAEAAEIMKYMNLRQTNYAYGSIGRFVTVATPKKSLPMYLHERIDLVISGVLLVLRNH